ncbi:hypothetical protein TKK_0018948 [Trichogramma kaykai]
MNRRNRQQGAMSHEARWISTTSILISFEGDSLPKEISIFHVITKVTPHVKKNIQCLKCFKFSHIAKDCRSKARCSLCGEEEHEEGASCQGITPRCANCKESHKFTDKKCSIYKKHDMVNIKMAYDNISYFEAKQLVFNKYSAPSNTKEIFPSLRNATRNAPAVTYTTVLKEPSRVSQLPTSSNTDSSSSEYLKDKHLQRSNQSSSQESTSPPSTRLPPISKATMISSSGSSVASCTSGSSNNQQQQQISSDKANNKPSDKNKLANNSASSNKYTNLKVYFNTAQSKNKSTKV